MRVYVGDVVRTILKQDHSIVWSTSVPMKVARKASSLVNYAKHTGEGSDASTRVVIDPPREDLTFARTTEVN